jgi:ribonuclease PH
VKDGVIEQVPVTDSVAAVSVGKVGGQVLLDLNYEEDSKAQVDMNVVMTGSGKFVEVQGTAEESAFTRQELDELTRAAQKGIRRLIRVQGKALEEKG